MEVKQKVVRGKRWERSIMWMHNYGTKGLYTCIIEIRVGLLCIIRKNDQVLGIYGMGKYR